MTKKRVAVFVGSLRKESFNRKMAKALMALAPESLELEIVEIGGLPLYDQDLDDEGRPPSAWTEFRQHGWLRETLLTEWNYFIQFCAFSGMVLEDRTLRSYSSSLLVY